MSPASLCVVIPGHHCPDPDTCSGKVNVPVKHKISGQNHLLASCYHNLGATAIKPFFSHSAEIDVSGTVCCTFQMYQDETSPNLWDKATSHPVRAVAKAFKAKGIEIPFHHP